MNEKGRSRNSLSPASLASGQGRRRVFRMPCGGPIAQRSEQATHNRLVVGSNPTGPTSKKDPENKGESGLPGFEDAPLEKPCLANSSNVSAHSPRRVRSTGRRLSSASLLSVRAMSRQPFALRPEKRPAKHPMNVRAIARAYVPETSRQCPSNHAAQSAKQVASRTRIIRGASGWQATQQPDVRLL